MSNNIYGGYVDEKSVESSMSNLHFGLNQKCKLANIKYVADNTAEYIEFTFNINGTDVNHRIYPVTEIKDGANVITDPSNELFKKALQDLGARMTSIFKCFTSDEAITASLSKLQNVTFKQYVEAYLKLINPAEAKNVSLDIFLNYRFSPADDGKKYLEIPKTRKHGAFICKHIPGIFEEVRDKDGLKYMSKEGNLHPFVRSTWFMESEYANKGTGNTPPSNLVTSAPLAIPNPFITSSSSEEAANTFPEW